MIIDAAKSVRVEDEIARRGIRLIGRGHERVGPCPRCGGRDRFSINIAKQVFHCRGCGRGGDVVDLVQHLDGVDFRTAVQTLGGIDRKPLVPPAVAVVAVQAQENEAERIAYALKLWDDASPIEGTPIAEAYFARRGLELEQLPGEDVLRFLGGCPFGDARHPCILALYRDIITNEPKAISRTAIGPGGTKINRKALGPVMGCAVKLDADENVEQGLHVGEGVETMQAARQRGFKPAWALGSSGAIRRFPALPGIDCLTVVVDHDAPDQHGRRAGQEAALECARRWHAAGKEVFRLMPHQIGADFADLTKGRAA